MDKSSNIPPATSQGDDGLKMMIWPDGSWCWDDDFRPADYTHMSDDYQVINLSNAESLKRLLSEYPALAEDIAPFR